MKGFYEVKIWSARNAGETVAFITDVIPALKFARGIIDPEGGEHAQILADHWPDGSVIVEEDGFARWQYRQTYHEDANRMIGWQD